MEPFRDVFGIPHQHVRFSSGTKAPAVDDAPQAKPRGACWWCNRCGTDNQSTRWSCRICRQIPDWPNL
eukprot:10324952-Alexandrium_andersonii.AAC.1